jgi:hypothetical protein
MDGVTLSNAGCVRDYGQRCGAIGLERRNVADLQDAKNHPEFKRAHHELLDRLAREYRASRPLLERPVRWTIKGGGYKSKKDLVNALKAKGHRISDWATKLVNNKRFVLMAEGDEYDVFETTVKELAGKDVVTTTELYEIRDRLGFCDAPFETALLVRMEYDDQPMDTWEYALSEPLADADGDLIVLYVARYSGGSWVRWFYAYPDYQWLGGYRLLVCRKRLAS